MTEHVLGYEVASTGSNGAVLVRVVGEEKDKMYVFPPSRAYFMANLILETLAVAGFKPAPLKNNDHEDDAA